ncbi:SprT family zinc-dependent metalloprotease [soil metagenome]
MAVSFRRNKRARRLIIRLTRTQDSVVVTLPPRSSKEEALDFARRSRGWIAARLAAGEAKVSFACGSAIPLRGTALTIVQDDAKRGTVRLEPERDLILVTGDSTHHARRVTDWLKAEAKRDLLAASARYATLMSVKFHRVSVRDQRSRWGSCTSDGSLSYSWRLILAPSFVLDYVAAHEVAHLSHMDHSARFWRVVLAHCPGARDARSWLRRNGASLHRYG